MNLEPVERLANAVLYEGYMLYPYRPSAVKNQRRFNFGVLAPPSYSAAQGGTETSAMCTECLVCGTPQSVVAVKLRCLQVSPGAWQQAVEQQVNLPQSQLAGLLSGPFRQEFCFGENETAVKGAVTLSARGLDEGLFRIAVDVVNETALEHPEQFTRDEVLPYSLVAAHTILGVEDGEFVSLLDPPEQFREAAAECRNTGTWPVLAGEPGSRSLVLSSPIILYDYAQVSPESPGDLFDGAEIDEILTLRIMTLTDEEKEEMRNSDERARRILERTETLPEEHFMKLHGVLRALRPAEERK